MPWLISSDRDIVRRYWTTVDEVDDATLDGLLTSARVQCEAFAPVVLDDDGNVTVPEPYTHAQTLQAMALNRAGYTGPNDFAGADGLGVTVYPMDWTVKALLRPKRGRPAIA